MSNNTTREAELITAIHKTEIIINPKSIENFWRLINPIEIYQKTKVDPRDLTIDLINQAHETILIYSPYVTYDTLKIALEDQAKKGIRIYVLTKNLQIHQKILSFCVVRERPTIDSTFILIDYDKKSSARGIWFPNDLTKENSSQPFVLEFNSSQITSTNLWFKSTFWDAIGDELFFGKRRPVKQLALEPDKGKLTDLILKPRSELKNILEREEILEIWIDLAKYEELSMYLAEANTIIFELQENLKDVVDFESIRNANKVYAVSAPLPFHYIRTEEKGIIYTDDLIFQVDNSQDQVIRERSYTWPWELVKRAKISEIKGKILIQKHNWNDAIPISMKDNTLISLDPVKTNNINEWVDIKTGKAEKKPKYPDDLALAHEITYQWTIEPPHLPRDAKKHRLYGLWGEFNKKYAETIEAVISRIKSALDDENKYKKKKFLPKKGIWVNLIAELEQFLQINKDNSRDTTTLIQRIERISTIEQDFKSQLDELNSTAKEDHKEDNTSELDAFQKSPEKLKNNKYKGKEKNKNKDFKITDLKVGIPPSKLPSMGVLYEWNNKNYLLIEYFNEIELAKNEINNFSPCEICVRSN